MLQDTLVRLHALLGYIGLGPAPPARSNPLARPPPAELDLFGGSKYAVLPPSSSPHPTLKFFVLTRTRRPWFTPATTWTAIDDRVRGGASTSHLTPLPAPYVPAAARARARFHGTLDTATLGGAGFASQATQAGTAGDDEQRDGDGGDNGGDAWDLSSYDGIRVRLGGGDGKKYTLTLKDALPAGRRDDGREKAGVSWEADFEGRGNAEDGRPAEGVPRADAVRVVELRWRDFRATYRGKDRTGGPPLDTAGVKRFSLMMRRWVVRVRVAGAAG